MIKVSVEMYKLFKEEIKNKALKSSQTWKYLQGTEHIKQTGQL